MFNNKKRKEPNIYIHSKLGTIYPTVNHTRRLPSFRRQWVQVAQTNRTSCEFESKQQDGSEQNAFKSASGHQSVNSSHEISGPRSGTSSRTTRIKVPERWCDGRNCHNKVGVKDRTLLRNFQLQDRAKSQCRRQEARGRENQAMLWFSKAAHGP